MKLQHIISTMYRDEFDFLETMNITQDVLVVNQADRENQETFEKNGKSVCVVTTNERGLSNSRNTLLAHAKGDIVILGDDDLYYLGRYDKIIEDAYHQYPDADIIAFSFTQEMGKDTRRQFSKPKKLNILGIGKIASVEITFKLESIKEKGLQFDSLLGLGAKFGSGEENAFLADALKAGLVIRYIPATICYLKPDPEDRMKWKDGFNRDYFIKKGACFYRIYGKLFFPFMLAFVILKKRSIFKDVPVGKAIKWMREGKRAYKNAHTLQQQGEGK